MSDYPASQGFRIVDRWLRLAHGATIVLPVFGYDHGGLRLKAGERTYPFTDQWDSGFAGIVYDTSEAREECGTPRELVAEALAQEVELYDQWANGEMYGFVVEKRIDTDQWEEVDSLWGMYGVDYAMTEGKASIPDAVGEAARITDSDDMVTVNFSVTVKVKASDWTLAYGVQPHEVADDMRTYFEGWDMHPGLPGEIDSSMTWKRRP